LQFSELMVVTPTGNRPVRAGLVGAAGAVVLGALLLGVAVLSRRRPPPTARTA
jgi:hypothetical protein